MTESSDARGRAVVMQPDDGQSFWQPVPANGYSHPKLTPANTAFEGLSMGFQAVAANGRVREHSHGDQIELLICFSGKGRAVVDGANHELVPGTTCFVGYDVMHEIINEHDEELVMMWVIAPAGLETFFETIGRPRHAGEAPPEPFARPDDVVAIERDMGVSDTVLDPAWSGAGDK